MKAHEVEDGIKISIPFRRARSEPDPSSKQNVSLEPRWIETPSGTDMGDEKPVG